MGKQKRYAAALLVRGAHVLLGKRSATRKTYPGYWDLLGGHCEKKESLEKAMLREVREECGVKATVYTLLRTIDVPGEFIMAVYQVTAWEGQVFNAEVSEHEELRWFPLTEAATLTFPDPGYQALLGEVRQDVPIALNNYRVFLLDSIGAFCSALLLIFLIAPFQAIFGLPAFVAHVLAGLALVIAMHSAGCYFYRKRSFSLKLIAVMLTNLGYSAITAVMIAWNFAEVTNWGLLYFTVELAIIFLLMLWQWLLLQKQFNQ